MGNFLVGMTLGRVVNYNRKVLYKIDHRAPAEAISVSISKIFSGPKISMVAEQR